MTTLNWRINKLINQRSTCLKKDNRRMTKLMNRRNRNLTMLFIDFKTLKNKFNKIILYLIY
jgi:hypothetical protein